MLVKFIGDGEFLKPLGVIVGDAFEVIQQPVQIGMAEFIEVGIDS